MKIFRWFLAVFSSLSGFLFLVHILNVRKLFYELYENLGSELPIPTHYWMKLPSPILVIAFSILILLPLLAAAFFRRRENAANYVSLTCLILVLLLTLICMQSMILPLYPL